MGMGCPPAHPTMESGGDYDAPQRSSGTDRLRVEKRTQWNKAGLPGYLIYAVRSVISKKRQQF